MVFPMFNFRLLAKAVAERLEDVSVLYNVDDMPLEQSGVKTLTDSQWHRAVPK
jgi:hypothetical protein